MKEKKKRDKKKQFLIFGGLLLVVVMVGILVFLQFLKPTVEDNPKQPTETVFEYMKRIVYTAMNPEDLGTPNKDVGIMLMDCDSTEMFDSYSNIKLVSKKEKHVQGTGSFGRQSPLVSIGQGVFKEPVDISAYKKGSLHISLYVSDPSKMKKEVWFELSSNGKADSEEISWVIPRSVIKSGWNEFYLSIPDAYKTGEIKLDAVNFYRMFEISPGYGLTILYDNIYVTNTKGVAYTPDLAAVEPDKYSETESPYGKMILSCNTTNVLRGLSNAKVTTKQGLFVEGTGAFKIDVATGAGAFVLKEPVNISAYKNGYVHFSLYASDAAVLTKPLVFELTSSGKADLDEMAFTIRPDSLQTGWNHLWLPYSSAIISGNPDMSAINFVRIYSNENRAKFANFDMVLDDVYASMDGERDIYAETAAAFGTMITSCNTINNYLKYSFVKVTTEQGMFVEGTGALKSIGKGSTLMECILKNPVDISSYINGYVHFSIYIDNPAALGDMVVLELTSSGDYMTDKYLYTVKTNTLRAGWNDCYMQTTRGAKKGTPDLTAINYVRIYCTNYDEQNVKRTVVLDNIFASMVQNDSYAESQITGGIMIASCNTANVFDILKDVKVTTAARQYVEGTGALKATGSGNSLMIGVLTKPVDISSYVQNGYLHLSFYVNDVSKLGEALSVELSSNENEDKEEYQWNIARENLKSGWNELFLKYSEAGKYGGGPNVSAIKRIRIYSEKRASDRVVIIDNIYAVNEKTLLGVKTCSCGNPIYHGDILMENCLCYFKSSFNMKITTLAAESDKALQAKNPQAGMYGTFAQAVDISDCRDGYIHLQIYVDDPAKVKNNISFELSSSGTYDKDEMAWEISKNSLNKGWNEIWLSVSEAAVTGSPKLQNINFLRLYTAQPNQNLLFIIDDVYASPTK